jgi:hypothetical protein
VTGRPHVPTCASENSIVPATRRLIRRRRPARDSRSACPNFSMISSMAPVTSADRPARDIGGPGPAAACRWRRDRCRSRSASRNSAGAADRRTPAWRARRWRRHGSEHVRCVFAADACARYHTRHSQHRWRALSSWSPIPGPLPGASARRDLAAIARGGQAVEVDLKTAARWISGWPPPKSRASCCRPGPRSTATACSETRGALAWRRPRGFQSGGPRARRAVRWPR